jgi:hypothetical protein
MKRDGILLTILLSDAVLLLTGALSSVVLLLRR